jgi:cytochrome c oxidase subunit 2
MLKFAIFGVLLLAVAGFGLYVLFPAALKPSPEGGRKRWGYLFGTMLLAEALLFVVAPLMNWWLPKGVSTYSDDVDLLFYVILAVTGVTFIGVSAVFVYALFKYPRTAGRKSLYTHGSHKLETIWTAIPAVLLIVLAVGQIPAWFKIKSTSWLAAKETGAERFLQIDVTARQWEWRMRYPSLDHMREWDKDHAAALKDVRLKLPPRPDDVRRVNEIHCVKNQKVMIHLKTLDVIHSFFLPHMRLKQDALPGRTMPIWFEATEANTVKQNGVWVDGMRFDEAKKEWVKDDRNIWELACAEYCGSRHSLMRGKLYVHSDQKDFEDWLATAEKEGRAMTDK